MTWLNRLLASRLLPYAVIVLAIALAAVLGQGVGLDPDG